GRPPRCPRGPRVSPRRPRCSPHLLRRSRRAPGCWRSASGRSRCSPSTTVRTNCGRCWAGCSRAWPRRSPPRGPVTRMCRGWWSCCPGRRAGSSSTDGRPASSPPGRSSTAGRGPRPAARRRPVSAPPRWTASPDRSPSRASRRRPCPRRCGTTTRGGCPDGSTEYRRRTSREPLPEPFPASLLHGRDPSGAHRRGLRPARGGGAMTGPLEGILVADCSRVLAGPLCTMNLADLGATVVKVERPGRGDDTRSWGPPWSANGTTYFESVNRSKRSVALDFADPDDLALARELARRADVLVENFRPGTLDRLGLGYDRVSEDNPGIVYCSVTGFGGGAGAGLLGYDFVVQAVGGLMSITGEPDGEPTNAGVALADVVTGMDAAIAVLASLAARSRTGRGCRVVVNLLSGLLGSLVNQAQGYLETGRPPGRMGNGHPSIAPYE